ncbi:unnamed protein product [Parajaminaea phylloscopi]
MDAGLDRTSLQGLPSEFPRTLQVVKRKPLLRGGGEDVAGGARSTSRRTRCGSRGRDDGPVVAERPGSDIGGKETSTRVIS